MSFTSLLLPYNGRADPSMKPTEAAASGGTMDLEGEDVKAEGDEVTAEGDEETGEGDEVPMEDEGSVEGDDEGSVEGDDEGSVEGDDEGSVEGDDEGSVEGDKVTLEGDEVKVEADEDVDLEAIRKKAEVVTEDVIKSAMDAFLELQLKEEAAKAKYRVKNIQWMKCEDFTVSRGVLQIEEYLKTWELHESWLHWTCYLSNEELQYTTQYHYRVCWSIPTCRKPIPRATASVYFIVEISKIKPPTLPVEVFFMVETNKLIHRPGQSRFKEKWLKDVIESKICVMEAVDF